MVLMPRGDRKKRIYAYLNEHPKTTNAGLSKAFPEVPLGTLRSYKSMWSGSFKDATHSLEHLKWLYELMVNKIIKGVPPTDKERKRLQVIEALIGYEG